MESGLVAMDVEFIVIETLDTGGHLRVGHYIVSQEQLKDEYLIRFKRESEAVATGEIVAFTILAFADPNIDSSTYRNEVIGVNA